MRRALLILGACALTSQAQARPVPAGPPPAEAEIWPFPPPDPQGWWDDKRPGPGQAADPLGGRRLPRGQRLPVIDNGVEPATYRLWGLMPLQWQLLRGDEMILEVWVRPARSVRQSIVRITVRDDGRGFVQGRAGYACCEAGIGRRMGFDAELAPAATASFLALRDNPIWSASRDVRQVQDGATADVICVSGVGYDLTLLTRRGARSLHRECDDVPIGQAADLLEPVLRAALGRDARFDVLFHGRVDFSAERQAYQDFTRAGGQLKAAPAGSAPPPGFEPQP